MSRRRRTIAPESALACIAGGAVTSERLTQAAREEGRGGSPLIRSLMAQSLPSAGDLARVYARDGGALRLDESFLAASPKAAALLDPRLLRRHVCLPVSIMDRLCILAVAEGKAQSAVRAVRAALQREVLPVLSDAHAIADRLSRLPAVPHALRLGAARREPSLVQSRFRDLVLGGELREALPLPSRERE